MVDAVVLANDIAQNVVFLATPPLLWLFLYLFAWESPGEARATGFSRQTFWLLLPGSLLGSISNLPFVPVGSNIVAINVGGGLLPLLLAGMLLRRKLADRPGAAELLGGLILAESALALVAVIAAPSGGLTFSLGSAIYAIPWGTLLPLVPVIAFPLVLAIVGRFDPVAGRAAYGLSLMSLALGLTFLTTEAIPRVGIVSSFPGYLAAPAICGVLAVLLARPWGQLSPSDGLPIGYATATVGVLVGADVLRQPPLYAASSSALYSIGGAGLLDLLYLSGLLALGAAFLTFRLLRRWRDEPLPGPGPSEERPTTPTSRLRTALFYLLIGRFTDASRESAAAVRDARTTARTLAGLPAESFTGHPWGDLGASPWADGDDANLAALGNDPTVGGRDAWRAHMAARYLVRLGRDLTRRRLGTLWRRVAAFSIDLILVTVPAVALWAYLSATLPGTPVEILGGAAFNAAALGYAAYAFVYFALSEALWANTPGKRWLHLRVRGRGLRPATPIRIVLRDLPKLVPLTIIGIGGAVATFLAVRGGSLGLTLQAGGAVAVPTSLLVVTYLVALVLLGLGLCGFVSAVAITASGENQRLGDYLAGTWVIQE